jgi:hypothetical protein
VSDRTNLSAVAPDAGNARPGGLTLTDAFATFMHTAATVGTDVKVVGLHTNRGTVAYLSAVITTDPAAFLVAAGGIGVAETPFGDYVADVHGAVWVVSTPRDEVAA